MAIIKEMSFKISSDIENLASFGLSDSSTEKTEITPSGFFKIDGDQYIISYTEESENGRIFTDITVETDRVMLKRRGAVISDMEFCEGAEHASEYSVPPYVFDTVIKTKKIRNKLTRSGGRLDLYYEMNIGGQDKKVRMKIECTPTDKD